MRYSILINTCDKFADCWEPFFKLFERFWPDCGGGLFLNTEYEDYSYAGLEVTAIRGCEVNGSPRERRASWSQCLRWALEQIPTDILLYMQEDYFLKAPVSNEDVESMVQLMLEHEDIKCIHLTDQAVLTGKKSQFDGLVTVDRKQRYRVSCQAALWRKDELMQIVRERETAWEFEEFGSKRSSVMNHRYLCVDPCKVQLDKSEILPYIFTGIIQGRWNDQVVSLFADNDIGIDYSIRGMYSERGRKPLRKRIQYRIHKTTYSVVAFLDRLAIKKQSDE